MTGFKNFVVKLGSKGEICKMSQAIHIHLAGSKKYKTLSKFETLVMCARIYMTLSYKIEKIVIHSVVGEISCHDLEGGKKIISKNQKN